MIGQRLALIVSGMWLALATSASAEQLLDELTIRDGVLTVTFSCQVTRLSVFRSNGDLETRARLAPASDCTQALADAPRVRRWTEIDGEAHGLEYVELHVDEMIGNLLLLRFATPRKPEVRSGPGPATLQVVLNAPQEAAPAPASSGRTAAARAPKRAKPRPPTKVPEDKIAAIMEEARQAFSADDLDRAVALYTRLTEIGEHELRPKALEFLGVTRERKGQSAHAKATFDRYLLEYPEGEGRKRVQQRLAAITAPPGQSRSSARAARRDPNVPAWDIYGSHSSYGRRAAVSMNDLPEVTNVSMLQTNFDIIARRRGGDIDILSRLTAGYLADFANLGRDRSNAVITNAYINLDDRQRGLSARLGRQSRSGGGVYGRFDGAHLAWDWRDDITLNAVAGFPVQRPGSTIESDRSMFGVSADIGSFGDNWDVTTFFNNHVVDGITDRRGIGGEFRYFNAGKNIYGLVDYDTLYSSVNASMLSASWYTDSGINLHGTLDYRRSPLLSTSNAIIGQGVTSIEELETTFTEDELQALAEDNTATSTSATLGLSVPLSPRFQFSADLRASRLETAASFSSLSGAQPSTDTLSLNAQLVAASWWLDRDAWIVGVGLTDSDTYRTSSLTLNTRLPLTAHLRINPLLRVVYRENQLNATDEWIFSPGLRARLRWQRHFVIEAEMRGETSTRSTLTGDMDRSSYYFSLGYRADFGR